MERINKSLIQVLQLKPAVMLKYGSELLEKVWEISDDINNYIPPEDLLSQPADKRLTPMEMMKYFLQLLFGGANKIDEILEKKYITIDEEKKKIMINEEEIKNIKFRDNEITSIEWIPKDKLLKMFEETNIKITEGSKQSILLLSSKGFI